MNTPSTSIAKKQKSAVADNGVCPICGGAGFLRRDVPVDHPDFGRAFPCECKIRETQQASLDDLRRNSGLNALSQMTFETFRPDGNSLNPIKPKNLRQVFEKAKQFARQGSGWLVLMGGYGTGKTHLAAAIANDRVGRGDSVLFVVVPDLLDYLRATFAPMSRITYDDRFESVRNAPFLILDDLGAQSATAWAQEKLFQLLNHRYNEQLATVITTNRDMDEIEPSIRSRLSDSHLCTVEMIAAPDFRQAGTDLHGSGMSNLALYSDMTFESFNLRGDELKGEMRENLRRVFHIAQDYARRPQGMIVFTGDYGSGKTHLAAATANSLTQHGHSVLFVVVPDLLDHLRAAFAPGSTTSFDHRFEEARNAPYLVLDDFGTENATPWAREKLFQIIDYRYVAQLPTIITIARAGSEIEPRVQTRIFDLARSSVNEILAPSFRTTHRRTLARPENNLRKPRSK